MPKCEHNNVTLTELGSATTAHIFEGGKLIYHNSGEDDYTGVVRVSCRDCKLDRTYNRYSKRCPEWVKTLFSRAMDEEPLIN